MAKQKIELNWFERGLYQVAPKMALNRVASRMRLDMLTGDRTRNYDAGKHTRSTDGWRIVSGSSANAEIGRAHSLLVDRSRDLVRNNPYAKKAVQVITSNVVGTGVRPSLPKNVLKPYQERPLMAAWRDWAETTACDHDGQFDIYGLQMMACRAYVESGDAFFRVIRQSKFSAVPIKLQLLEADYLDTNRDGEFFGNGNYCMQGIEFNAEQQRVAYWMFEKHPADAQPMQASLLSKRIPSDEIIHVYEKLRPGQIRGVPAGVAAFMRLRSLDSYEDAQLTRQIIASCFSVFIRRNDVNFADSYKESKYEDTPGISEKLTPGTMEYLEQGEDITFANPPGVTGYEPYTRSLLRSIADAYGITYEALTGDLTGVNFSSGRMGWLEMHRKISQDQKFIMIGMMCNPVWSHFFKAVKMSGAYKGPSVSAEWTPPRREMIDPVKEVKGMKDAIRAGLTSRSEAVRELGNDPEKLFAEIVAEQVEADGAGLMLDSDAKHDPTRVNFGKDAYLQTKTKVATEVKPKN